MRRSVVALDRPIDHDIERGVAVESIVHLSGIRR